MRCGAQRIALCWLLVLAGCQHAPESPAKPYRELPVVVAVGCVQNRPMAPQSLRERYSDDQWTALAPGAMARAVQAQAGDRLNYADKLDAATKGCKAAP
jgi:hypothetical protein